MFPLHCQLSNIGDLDEDAGTRGKVADTHCKDILECVCIFVFTIIHGEHKPRSKNWRRSGNEVFFI